MKKSLFVFVFALTITACGGGGKNLSHPSQDAPKATPTLHFSTNSDKKAEMNWDAMPSATTYRVYYSSDSSLAADKTTVVETSDTHFVFTDLKPGETVYVSISAVWETKESARSGIVSVKLPAENSGQSDVVVTVPDSTTTTNTTGTEVVVVNLPGCVWDQSNWNECNWQ